MSQALALDSFGGVSRFLETEKETHRFCNILLRNLTQKIRSGMRSTDVGGDSKGKKKRKILFFSQHMAFDYLKRKNSPNIANLWGIVRESWDIFTGKVSEQEIQSLDSREGIDDRSNPHLLKRNNIFKNFGLLNDPNLKKDQLPKIKSQRENPKSVETKNKNENSEIELLDFTLICRLFDDLLFKKCNDSSLDVGLREMIQKIQNIILSLKNLNN